MTVQQILAIKCAHADLKGALENFEQLTPAQHDWKAHKQTIEELEEFFDFLTITDANNQTED
jgi:hypothetical protein